LQDLVSIVVHDRKHRSERSPGDAAVVGSEIVEVVEAAVLDVGALHRGGAFRALRGQRWELAVLRIDDERRLPRRLATLEPMRRRRGRTSNITHCHHVRRGMVDVEVGRVERTLAIGLPLPIA
jgi:hypothetical protein